MKKVIFNSVILFIFLTMCFILSCTKDLPGVQSRIINKTIEVDLFGDGILDSLDIDADGKTDFYIVLGGNDNNENNFSKIIPVATSALDEIAITYDNGTTNTHLRKYTLNERVGFSEPIDRGEAFLHHNVINSDTLISVGLGGSIDKYIAFKINGFGNSTVGNRGWLKLNIATNNKRITIMQCGYLIDKNTLNDLIIGSR